MLPRGSGSFSNASFLEEADHAKEFGIYPMLIYQA
jgi:hypothetical protein